MFSGQVKKMSLRYQTRSRQGLDPLHCFVSVGCPSHFCPGVLVKVSKSSKRRKSQGSGQAQPLEESRS